MAAVLNMLNVDFSKSFLIVFYCISSKSLTLNASLRVIIFRRKGYNFKNLINIKDNYRKVFCLSNLNVNNLFKQIANNFLYKYKKTPIYILLVLRISIKCLPATSSYTLIRKPNTNESTTNINCFFFFSRL